jgi:signal peptidase I
VRVLLGAAALAGLLVLRARPFRVEVAGVSMEPTLLPGDYLVATKSGAIRRGALVVVERPGEPSFELVKRVVGLQGDSIDHRLLQADEYWVVGDKPDQSTDSRTFGPVNRADIKGVVRLRYWPRSRARWVRQQLGRDE